VQLLQQIITRLLDDLRARIVILVYPVTKTHKPFPAILVLCGFYELGAIISLFMNLLQHLQHRLIGASVQRPPQRAYPRGCARKQIRPA
jgi:hypothetical protein